MKRTLFWLGYLLDDDDDDYQKSESNSSNAETDHDLSAVDDTND